MPFDDLFAEVVELTKNATLTPPNDEDPTSLLCMRVDVVQKRLASELKDMLPSIARIAALQGKKSVDLLTFTGSEKYDDEFSYLFLLKGPRDREQKYDLYKHGFVPLFESLMVDVAPFGLTFTWVPGCNLNKLTLVWE